MRGRFKPSSVRLLHAKSHPHRGYAANETIIYIYYENATRVWRRRPTYSIKDSQGHSSSIKQALWCNCRLCLAGHPCTRTRLVSVPAVVYDTITQPLRRSRGVSLCIAPQLRHSCNDIDMPPWLIICKYDVIHDTGSTRRIATSREEDRPSHGHRQHELVNIGRVRSSRDMFADRHTNRLTLLQAHHNTPLLYEGGGVTDSAPVPVRASLRCCLWWVSLSIRRGSQIRAAPPC